MLFGLTMLNTDAGLKLFHFLECNNLAQLVKEPTRITKSVESILDLIISNSPGLFVSTGSLSPPSNCDHNIAFGKLSIFKPKTNCYVRLVRNFNNIDVNQLNYDNIVRDFTSDIDVIYENWFELFSLIVDRYIPRKIVMIRPGDKSWMNGAIRRAIRKCDRLLKAYTKFKSSFKWEKYRINRNLVFKLIRKAKLDYQQKTNEILSNPATSAKKWWNVAKSFYGSKVSSAIPPLYENNNYVFDPKDKADLFNDFFVSQTYLPIENAVLPELSPNLNPTLSNIIVTEVEVANLICQLDTAKACGMDGISNKIKLCNHGIYKPFTKLINISLSLGQFPQSWKLANVLPLFKKDNKQIKSNYRPVALLSCLSKICEKVVYMKVYTFLVSICFFYRFQSGFRSGDSTVMQLVYIVNKIYHCLDRGNEVRAVFLIYQKHLIRFGQLFNSASNSGT